VVGKISRILPEVKKKPREKEKRKRKRKGENTQCPPLAAGVRIRRDHPIKVMHSGVHPVHHHHHPKLMSQPDQFPSDIIHAVPENEPRIQCLFCPVPRNPKANRAKRIRGHPEHTNFLPRREKAQREYQT
jgi:hypothetical protein